MEVAGQVHNNNNSVLATFIHTYLLLVREKSFSISFVSSDLHKKYFLSLFLAWRGRRHDRGSPAESMFLVIVAQNSLS